jgi:hypothetical protein
VYDRSFEDAVPESLHFALLVSQLSGGHWWLVTIVSVSACVWIIVIRNLVIGVYSLRVRAQVR